MLRSESWRADDPDRAWAELFFLAQSPLWMIAVAVVIGTGWVTGFGDVAFMGFGLATMAPAVIGPFLFAPAIRPLGDSYWVKLNLWVAIVVFFGTYIGTHYFFDLMGMSYAWSTRWNLNSAVVGHRPGVVPAFMYPLTHAYFVTYFVALSVALRWVTRRLSLGSLGRAIAVVVLAYALAFLETFFMASDALSGMFDYADKDRMLALGSVGYSVYFIIGLPMLCRIDRDGRWPLHRVAIEALATCMMILFALEAWAQVVGPL